MSSLLFDIYRNQSMFPEIHVLLKIYFVLPSSEKKVKNSNFKILFSIFKQKPANCYKPPFCSQADAEGYA